MPKIKTTKNNIRFSRMEGTGIPETNLNPEAPPFQQNFLQNNTIPTLNIPPIQQQIHLNAELELFIRKIVQQSLTSTDNTELVDEKITDSSSLADLDKIPDLVKTIRDFNGERSEYTAWRKSVDRIFTLYGHIRGSAKYFGIISAIRNKIVGNANVALESYNTPLNWEAIKKCLNTHYTDRRDIGTLEYQLTTLVQGRRTIDQFYQQVYSHLSMMLNNISSMELDRATEKAFIESYRNKALDTFIRGLDGDLPSLLAVREPKDLPEALHLCTKLANQNYRTQYANTKIYVPPQIQPMRTTNTYQKHFNLHKLQNNNTPNNYQQNNFTPNNYQPNNYTPNNYQQNNYTPHRFYPNNYPPIQNFQTQNYVKNNHQNLSQHPQYHSQQFTSQPQNRNPPPRPNAPKPRNYEPMDVDHSLHSKIVNYANRPQAQTWSAKQNTNQQNLQQNKQPNFHIDNTDLNETFSTYAQEYERQYEKYENQYDDQQQQTNNYDCIDTTDVHFLE